MILNDNAFVYHLYDKTTYKLKGLYPLKPIVVEPAIDNIGGLFLKFYFEDGTSYLLPYENIIHLKRFYTGHDIFGGNNSNGDHEAILNTVKMNDVLLQGVQRAMFSSFQIKGLLKINGMLKGADKQKQIDEFNRMLEASIKNDSAIVPVDGKAEYVPLTSDPKLVNTDTLKFTQSKILDYFGVSLEIYSNNYNEDQFNAFYESVIEPIAIQLSELFSNGLLTNTIVEKYGTDVFEFSETHLTINIPYNKNVLNSIRINDTQNDIQNDIKSLIIELIKNDNTITRQEIAEKLGVSKATVARHLRKINNIVYVGSSKNGYWKIKE